MRITNKDSSESVQIFENNFRFLVTTNPWRAGSSPMSGSMHHVVKATEIQTTVNVVASHTVVRHLNQQPTPMRKIKITRTEGSCSANQPLLHISSFLHGRNCSEPRPTPVSGVYSGIEVPAAQTIQNTGLVATRAFTKKRKRPTLTGRPMILQCKMQKTRWMNQGKQHNRWTEEEVLLMMKMKKQDYSDEDIAQTLYKKTGNPRTTYSVTRKWFREQRAMRESESIDDAVIALTQLQKCSEHIKL